VCEYSDSYCTHFEIFTIEGTINTVEEAVHKLWKFHSEQNKLEKPSLERHLLLLQFNYLHRLLCV
jgi:hypothetical protein